MTSVVFFFSVWLQSFLFKHWEYTVTRLDMIFRYPDRVPLTHFVHRPKKVFGMWAWIFCWVFCATGIFRRCNGKVFEHMVGANLWPSDYEPGVIPLRHCTLVCMWQWHSFCSLLGFSGRFCRYRKPNFPAVSGSYLPGFPGRICSYWQPNFPAISVVTLPCLFWHQKAVIFRPLWDNFMAGYKKISELL